MVYNPETEELVPIVDSSAQTVKNDLTDGKATGHATTHFTRMALGHPMIRWNDFIITADVYKTANDEITIHIICPRCRHALTIKSTAKQLSYDPDTNRLNIEPFMCTWEMNDDEAPANHFGMNLCKWKVGVKDNIAINA